MAAAEEPDFTSLLTKASSLTVRDEDGQEVLFQDLYKEKKAMVVFVRHFLCYICKEYVEDLAQVPPSAFEEVGVRLAVIGCAPHKHIKGFKETTGFAGEVFSDEQRAVYQALGLKYTLSTQGAGAHTKSSAVGGVLKSTWRALKNAGLQGDVKQQGGAFIINTDGKVVFGHQDAGSKDHTPINTLLEAAGMKPVEFKPVA